VNQSERQVMEEEIDDLGEKMHRFRARALKAEAERDAAKAAQAESLAEIARMKVRLEAAVAPPDYLERCAAEDAARGHMTGAVIISEDGCSGDTRIFTRASIEAAVDAVLERRRRMVQP
jgi:hypothetical protein